MAQTVTKIHDISQAELRSGSRRRDVVEARRVLSWLAVRELGVRVLQLLGISE